MYTEKTCKDYISVGAFILALIAGIKLRDPTRNQIHLKIHHEGLAALIPTLLRRFLPGFPT